MRRTRPTPNSAQFASTKAELMAVMAS